MNIWLISKYASPPQYAKAPSRLFFLGQEMVKSGHNVRVVTSDANHFTNIPQTNKIYNNENFKGVDLTWISTKKYVKTASISRVISWIDFEIKLFLMKIKNFQKPDIVVISSLSIFSIIYGYYLKKKYKSFLVFEIRDIWPLTMTEEGGFSHWHPLVILIGIIEKFGYRNADLVVGTMPRLHKHVKNILGYEKPFHCSPLGFNPENFEENKLTGENPFSKLAPKGKTIVGYAGSMGITNALESFIETIKLMKDDNVHFLLVGSGDLREGFQNSLKDYSNVTFLPRIAQTEVKYFLDVCDILYLSTQNSKVWEYGQSMNKVVEYMLASKPIVASYSGYPSMINEANCGVFVDSEKPEDLKNALLKYINLSNEERLEIGKNGRNWMFNNRTYAYLAKDYLATILNLTYET